MKTKSRVKKLVREKQKERRQKQHIGLKTSKIVSNTIIYIILVVIMVVWLVPFFFLLMDSFKCDIAADGETRVTWQSDTIIPKKFGLLMPTAMAEIMIMITTALFSRNPPTFLISNFFT